MSQTPAFVDFTWSFGDHALVFNVLPRPSPAMPFLQYLRAMILDPSAVWAFYVAANTGTGNIRDILFHPLKPFRNLLRGLIIEQMALHE